MRVILIETNNNGKFGIVVDNFSKENVLNALNRILKIDIDNIIQLSASMSYGIYGIKNNSFTGDLAQCTSYVDTDYQLTFIIEYVTVIK